MVLIMEKVLSCSSEKSYSTFGNEIYPGREMKMFCQMEQTSLKEEPVENRYRIVYLKSGNGIFQNKDKSQIITSPAIFALNFEDKVSFKASEDALMDVIYFSPFCFDRYEEPENFESWRTELGPDYYFFRAFFDRGENYIGVIMTSHSMGSRVQNLICSVNKILTGQPDDFWPCRSRSFFLELLITVNSIFSENEIEQNVIMNKISDEVMQIVEWINRHYQEKISLEDITKNFSTNKTTLNKKFKSEMGLTVSAYLISLRMQMASILLKKTYLSINEILFRTGYHDEANFMRAFKKFSGTTPGEYRKQFAEKYF